MVLTEQLTRDREVGQRAARESLRQQVAKLERELSGIVADGFPNIPATVPGGGSAASPASISSGGPRLLDLGELERQRDALALRVRAVRRQRGARAEFERGSRALLERMKLEPGRYKFVRVRAVDVGESGCGVWQVRPRLGIIGMLAGWWELTLSSGCP